MTPSKNLESSSLNKYIKYIYEAQDSIQSRFENVRDLLIGKYRKNRLETENWNYKTHPDILAFKAIWEELVPVSALEEYNEDLEGVLTDILNEIPLDNIPAKNLQINDRFSTLISNHEYSLVLAIFSIIASTLFCFGCGNEPLSEADYKLHTLVLPPVPEREESSELKKARKFVQNKAGTLDELYQELTIPLNNKSEAGDAYYLLAKYTFEINKDESLTDKEHQLLTQKLDKYLSNSIKNGNRHAIRLKNRKKCCQSVNSSSGNLQWS